MTALTHKENDLHNRLIVAEFNLGQAEKELRRLHEENKALRARLAQPEQKPVAWLYRTNNTWEHVSFVEPPDDAYDEGSLRPVYTAPPQREWIGLTDDEIVEIAATPAAIPGAYVHCFARDIEAKLKEKNT